MAHTGGMLALLPARASAATLAVEGGDPVDELHLTLAYLGDDVTEWPSELAAELAADLGTLAALLPGPVEASVFARAEFNHNGDGEREPCSVYLVGEFPALEMLRAAILERISVLPDVPDQHSPFVAHITAGFGIPVAGLTYTGPVQFDRLRLALADRYMDINLGPQLMVAEKSARRSAFSMSTEEAGPAVEFKNKVASKEGERRYGKPIGTELGQSRGSQDANAAQADAAAKKMYEETRGMSAKQLADYAAKLSDADLAKLHAVTYSFKSSNPAVIANRVALSGMLRKRGIDPGKHGSLAGKAGTSKDKPGAGQAKKPAAAKKGSMSDVEDRAWRSRAQQSGGRVLVDSLTEDARKKLLAAGWKGRPGDGAEALYPPQKGIHMDDIEVKRKFSDNKREKMAKGPKALGDGSYPIETIGDLANAIKAYGRADDDKKDKVKAHIVKNAKRLNATNMLPADWEGSTKGKGKGEKPKKGVNPFAGKSLNELSDDIETKFMSPDPRAAKLRKYWARGEGRAKWNTFRELRNHLRKYVPKHMLDGLTANIYKMGKGHWPGKGRGDKDAQEGVETTAVLTPDELKAAAALDAEVDLDEGLDDHAALADSITTEQAYEQALADEVEWEADGDGDIVPVDESDEGSDEWDDPEWDGIDEGPEDFDDLEFGPEDPDDETPGELVDEPDAEPEVDPVDAQLDELERMFSGEDAEDDEDD